MLVRHLGVLALTLVSIGSFSAAPTLAGSRAHDADALAKRLANKSIDRDGYAPVLAKGAAGIPIEVEPNDTAAQATPVGVGSLLEASIPDGDVDWFVVSGANGYLTLSTASSQGSATDTVLEAFASDGTTRLSIDDDAGLGLFSAIQHLTVPGDGEVLVRVTRFGPLGDDAYVLSVELGTPPPPSPDNDTPQSALALETCNTTVSGSTSGASSEVSGLGCVQFAPLGGDVFYVVELPYSYQLTAVVDPGSAWDPSLYLFTDPSDPAGSCLIGNDEAFGDESEVVIYTNEDETTDPMIVYVGIDSWEPAQSGDFSLVLSCDFVVGTDTDSWGGLKARFEE